MAFVDSLKNLVGTVAPMLGTALGGPFGGVAGKMIQDALGVDSDEAAFEVLQQDPEALLKVKQLDGDFKTKMRELGIKEQQLHADDRKSARDLAKSKGIYFQAGLTLSFMAGYFGLFWLFFYGGQTALNDWQRGQVGILIGVLTAAVPQLLAFWFGSSKGSSDKTAALVSRDQK